MTPVDTVEWYEALKAKVAAAKVESPTPRSPAFSCCGNPWMDGHDQYCVNFHPVGDTKFNRIVEHIPNFASGFDPRCVEFNTLEELMEVSWVKSWTESPEFHRFSADSYLMVERENGYWWWTIGKLRHPVDRLPTWEPKYKDKQ